jgi:HPt (histidine-containing phosphotransfer) domain-containing protein
MDMQMPEMGGVEATQHIRNGQVRPDIPIVALTANAMDEERRHCMDAGMNGFLTKPIEPQKLIAMVAQWRPQQLMDITEPAEAPPLTTNTSLPELPGIDVDVGLSYMLNRPALYEKILRDFYARFNGEMDRILAALAANETEEATRRAHSLKGLSATIGAQKVSGLAIELEDAILNNKPDIDSSLADLETELALVLEGIRQGFKIE